MSVILGIDYGEKRVGVAISDETGTLAVPSETLTPVSPEDLFAELQRIVDEKTVEKIVVGLPLGLSGKPTEQTKKTQDFIRALEGRLNIPVDFQDERLTSAEAERNGGQLDSDARAAALILQSYLERVSNASL